MINYMRNQDQYTFIGASIIRITRILDLASSMFGSMGGRGGRGRMFGGSRDGISTSANAEGTSASSLLQTEAEGIFVMDTRIMR